MPALSMKVTAAGRAALVNASNTGTLPVLVAQIGVTATGFTANPAGTDTVLPGELKRLATFAGDVVAADTLHVTLRDDSTDSYSLKGFALYLADGTLFALYGQTAEIMGKSEQSTLLLATDVQFTDIDAAGLTFGDNHDKQLPPCKAGHAARHILDSRRASAGGGHMVECACGSTRKHPTFEAALAEWKRQHRIRTPRRRPAVATTVVQMDLHLQAARGRR